MSMHFEFSQQILCSRWPFALPIAVARGMTAMGASPQTSQKDAALRVTIHQTAVLMNLDGTAASVTIATAIRGEGNDVYGSHATLKVSAGTYGAVLNLVVGKRKLSVILPPPIPGSGANSFTLPSAGYLSLAVRGSQEPAGPPK
jgi:hypothetical protein